MCDCKKQSNKESLIRSRNAPFIIAECGVNFRDLVDADQMIKAAAEAGADAVKFQAYNTKFTECAVGEKHPHLTYHPRAKELNAIRLDESTIRYLYWRCQQHGIEFMCTPMYPEAVGMLDPYVKRWKVRYADRENWDLLRLLEKTKKEILLSTDNPDLPVSYPRIKRFYCCSEYPPKSAPALYELRQFDGYSCHIPCWRYPQLFKETSLKYLEVHVRLDHYESPHYCPIDTAVSITMSELAELCRRLKQ